MPEQKHQRDFYTLVVVEFTNMPISRVFPSVGDWGIPHHDFVPSIKALSPHKNFQKTIAYC